MSNWKRAFFAIAGMLAFGVPLVTFTVVGCHDGKPEVPNVQQSDQPHAVRDVIMVAGRPVHTGTPVVLWTDPPYYNAYSTKPRFPAPTSPTATTGPSTTAASRPAVFQVPTKPEDDLRYGQRRPRTPEIAQRLKAAGGVWKPDIVAEQVDQFVIHYDVCGTSKVCFKVLQDDRKLSVHFMLDLDGTIYQTLDVTDRAFHATVANDRSVGIEIAQIGAYEAGEFKPFAEWYKRDWLGRTRLTLPARFGDGGLRTMPDPMAPARNGIIRGSINGQAYVQYDFTPQQYEALARLTAALSGQLPNLKVRYPADAAGRPLQRTLTAREFNEYQGLLGHYHVTDRKSDPGPAFDWDKVIRRACELSGQVGSVAEAAAPAMYPTTMPDGEVTADEAKAGITAASKAAEKAAKSATTGKGSSKGTSGPNRK